MGSSRNTKKGTRQHELFILFIFIFEVNAYCSLKLQCQAEKVKRSWPVIRSGATFLKQGERLIRLDWNSVREVVSSKQFGICKELYTDMS